MSLSWKSWKRSKGWKGREGWKTWKGTLRVFAFLRVASPREGGARSSGNDHDVLLERCKYKVRVAHNISENHFLKLGM